MADTDDSTGVSTLEPKDSFEFWGISRNTWIHVVGALVVVAIVAAVVVVVVLLLKKDNDEDNGVDNDEDNGGDNGEDNGNGDDDGDDDDDDDIDDDDDDDDDDGGGGEEKYDIISPWYNRQDNAQFFIPEPDAELVAECLERNEELNAEIEGSDEELRDFSWSTHSQWSQAKGEDPDFPPCLIWTEGLETPTDDDRTNRNHYMFRRSQEGIDLNKWNVHLGIKNQGTPAIPGVPSTLGECAKDIEDKGYPSFVYNFNDGMCFPKEEITPEFPWGQGNYYTGALFVPKQSTYDFVSTEGTTCADMGMDYIDDLAECEDAAQELGLKTISGDDFEVVMRTEPDRPEGCFFATLGGMNFAPNGTTGTQIKYQAENDAARLQICKRRFA